MVCSQATYGSHLPATGRTTPLSPPDVPEVMALGEASESNLEDPDWRIPILEWMVEGKLPTNSTEADASRDGMRRAKSFRLIDGDLYRQGAIGILMHCILMDQGRHLLQYIHARACGHHAATRAIVRSTFRQGFYWPTAVADAKNIVRSYEGFQFHAQQMHLTGAGASDHPPHLAFCRVGARYGGTIEKTVWGLQTPTRGN
jgi:hypothetical protein